MGKKSFIYRSVAVYRLVMNLLYLGRYKQRFYPVIRHLAALPRGSRVLELCFADVHIAIFCKKNGYLWTGLDMNANFVKTAKNLGFDARACDLTNLREFPEASVSVMMGSLYHFHPHTGEMIQKMFRTADTVIISEPVVNLSASGGLIGWLARKSANAGKGDEEFRYDKRSLMRELESHSLPLRYQIADVEEFGKDLVVKLTKTNAKP